MLKPALYFRFALIVAANQRVRTLLALFAITASASSALGQKTVTYEGLDADADGRLSIFEFGQLPGLYGSLDRFIDLDKSRDRFLSRGEWEAGSPDETGIPLGSDAIARAGARPGTAPSLSRHGPNVPLPPANDEKPKGNVAALNTTLLTGRGGATGPKRPPPPPALPPKTPVIPPDLRPPPR